jgi:deoxyribonuclease IV
MPLLGAHMSIAGGLHNAFGRLREVNGQALQVFLKNQRQWRHPPLSEQDIRLFREEREGFGQIPPVAAHDTYLINLAAPDPSIAEKSVTAFAAELEACARLGIEYLVLHPGSHRGAGPATGIARFAENLDRACAMARAHSVTVLIETTAGQGGSLGSSFEEIAEIMMKSGNGQPLGVCFDTCHAFAAGYDIRDERSYERTIARFDRTIGLRFLKFFHINDSKGGFSSHVDRHEHIGRGKIGPEGFRLLLNDPRFQSHPMVLETPKGKDLQEDRENLATLRSLLKAGDDSEGVLGPDNRVDAGTGDG